MIALGLVIRGLFGKSKLAKMIGWVNGRAAISE
jgi:hypothetical protein